MTRLLCFAIVAVAAGPVLAEPIKPVLQAKPVALIDPVTLEVNEGAAKRLDAEQKVRDLAWDTRMRRTMAGVCRGC